MARTKVSLPDLLTASTRLFRERGYGGTSMADLAAATGLTKGAFYHHFPDKAAVMEAALAATLAMAERRAFAFARGEAPLPERIERLAAGTVKLFGEGEGGCLVANTILDGGPDVERFRPHLLAFVDAWREALAALARDAGLPDVDAFAVRTIADVEGSIVLMRLYGERGYLEAAVARSVAALTDAPK